MPTGRDSIDGKFIMKYTMFKHDSVRIAQVTERVKKYLWEVSRLLIDEATVKSIGSYLEVEPSMIELYHRQPRRYSVNWIQITDGTVRRGNVNYRPSRLYSVGLITYVTGMEPTDSNK